MCLPAEMLLQKFKGSTLSTETVPALGEFGEFGGPFLVNLDHLAEKLSFKAQKPTISLRTFPEPEDHS